MLLLLVMRMPVVLMVLEELVVILGRIFENGMPPKKFVKIFIESKKKFLDKIKDPLLL